MEKFNTNLSYLRIVAIVCIVLHHCFCVYTGWPPNTGIIQIIPNWSSLLSELIKTFGLTIFTFISGYLFFYQKKKHLCFVSFVWNKTKRILIPAIIFGVLYWILFPQYMYKIFPACINGTHLWYLPMIFLCMLIVSFHFYLDRFAVCAGICIWFILLFNNKYSIFSSRTSQEVYYYLPIFYTGYLLNQYESFLYKYLNIVKIVGVVFLTISVFSLVGFFFTSNKYFIILIVGPFSYFLFRSINPNPYLFKWARIIDKNSFSIYLLHQFIINSILHYNINLINSIDWIYTILILFTFSFSCSLFGGILYERLRCKYSMVFF